MLSPSAPKQHLNRLQPQPVAPTGSKQAHSGYNQGVLSARGAVQTFGRRTTTALACQEAAVGGAPFQVRRRQQRLLVFLSVPGGGALTARRSRWRTKTACIESRRWS